MLGKLLIDEIIKVVADKDDFESKLNPPATKDQIVNLKSIYKLPKELAELMQFSNGLELFKLDDIDGYKFYSTEKIISENEGLKTVYNEEWIEDIIVFCEIIGEGNYIAIDLRNGAVLDGFHETDPVEWMTISQNLNDFLSRLIELKGEKYWLTQKGVE
jgi:hypothetical protein